MSTKTDLFKAQKALRTAGFHPNADGEWTIGRHEQSYDKGVVDGRGEGRDAARRELAETLIDVLELRAKYPDATRTVKRTRVKYPATWWMCDLWQPSPFTEEYYIEVTDFGYVTFLDDVAKLAAQVGADAARERFFGKK